MDAPAHLTESQKALWDKYVNEFDLDPVDETTLEAICVHFDRARMAGEEISKRGMILLTNGGQTSMPNPALKVEKDSHTLAVRLLSQLRRKYGTKTQDAKKVISPRQQVRHDQED